MKAWLKGGLWGMGIYLFCVLLTILIHSLFGVVIPLSEIASTPPLFLINPLLPNSYYDSEAVFLLISIIFPPLFWFLIGAIIGWIAGKFRER